MNSNLTTTASTVFSAYASFAASMMLVRSITDQLIPKSVQSFISSTFRYLIKSSTLTLVVDEYVGISRNEIFDAAELYLKGKISPLIDRVRVRKTQKQIAITSALDKNQQVWDTFEGVKLKWVFVSIEPKNYSDRGGSSAYRCDKRHYELSFHKKHHDKVMQSYLPFVLARAKAITEDEKILKLFTLDRDEQYSHRGSGMWQSVNLEHPSTFETLAMDPEMKKMIRDDLDRFLRRREFYKKVGKAWKRGYLLYGPPGTGKSSLIAAMANYLKFSIYDLELSSIKSNYEFRKALLSTKNRSILVIEDIDCSMELRNREAEEDDPKSHYAINVLRRRSLLNSDA